MLDHQRRRMNANRSTFVDPVVKTREASQADIVDPRVAVQVMRSAYEYAAVKLNRYGDMLDVLTDYIDKLESGEEVVTYVPPTQ